MATDLGRDSRRLVFVGGLHRSGTTPIARALAAHPEIAGLQNTGVIEDEGQHLQSVYAAARHYGGPGRFALSLRSHLTENSDLVSNDNARRLWEAWEPYWDLERGLLVEKSPPNLLMGRFLQAMFPGSALIVVIRHPVIVALSTVKWRRFFSRSVRDYASIETMMENWLAAYTTFVDDRPLLSRAVVLRYEDVMLEPSDALRPVQRLLGVQTPIPTSSLSAAHSTVYAARWMSMPGLRRRRLIDRFARRVADFGYDLEDVDALVPLSASRLLGASALQVDDREA